MSRKPPRFEPPAGFTRLEGPGGELLVVAAELLDELEAVGFGPAASGGVRASDLSGRRAMHELELPSGVWVLRRFERGGLVRHVRRGHSDPLRPFRELALSERLRAAGVATPRVGLARARPRRRAGWDLELGTRRVPGVVDAWEACLALGARPQERGRLLGRVGAALGEAFDAGLLHVDLNPRNLLVERPRSAAAGASRHGVWIIDLDRCRLEPAIDARARAAMLARTWRWVARRAGELEAPLGRAELARLVRSASGAGWREVWRASEAIVRRQAPWHRLGRGLDDLLSRRSGRRRQLRP